MHFHSQHGTSHDSCNNGMKRTSGTVSSTTWTKYLFLHYETVYSGNNIKHFPYLIRTFLLTTPATVFWTTKASHPFLANDSRNTQVEYSLELNVVHT